MRTPLIIFIIVAFILTSVVNPAVGAIRESPLYLPTPGTMVHLSPSFNPPVLKGIKVHPDNPFRFDFILDKGDFDAGDSNVGNRHAYSIQDESTKLIKYFLASLTVPEKDLWVNLSPYEKDRIVPEAFGQTEMGRDLLAQDYLLKQITASLIYPEDEIGKKFWKRIYEEAAKKFGTTNIPVNTFNKVWIVPEKAVVYENTKSGTAYVVESKLKVMLETDYLAESKLSARGGSALGGKVMLEEDYLAGKKNNVETQNLASLSRQIIQEIILPELTKEINQGKNFAQLRQVYQSLILATWYKKKIKDSILSQVYADKNKIAGVNIDDPQEKQHIYQQYLKAFKKGGYNYIKEEQDSATQQMIPRKYFSGGFSLEGISKAMVTTSLTTGIVRTLVTGTLVVQTALNVLGSDGGVLKSAQSTNSVTTVVKKQVMDNTLARERLNSEFGINIVNKIANILGNPSSFENENLRINFNTIVSEIGGAIKPLSDQDKEYIFSLFDGQIIFSDVVKRGGFYHKDFISYYLKDKEDVKSALKIFQNFFNQGNFVPLTPKMVQEFSIFMGRRDMLGKDFFRKIDEQYQFLWQFKDRSPDVLAQVRTFFQGPLAYEQQRARSLDPTSPSAVKFLTLNLLSHFAFTHQMHPFAWDAYRDTVASILFSTAFTNEKGMRYNAIAKNLNFGSGWLKADPDVLSGVIFHELGHRKLALGGIQSTNSNFNIILAEMLGDLESYYNLNQKVGGNAMIKYKEQLTEFNKRQIKSLRLNVLMSPKQVANSPDLTKDKEAHHFARLQIDYMRQVLGDQIGSPRFYRVLNQVDEDFRQEKLPKDVMKEILIDENRGYVSIANFVQYLLMRYFAVDLSKVDIKELPLKKIWYKVNEQHQIIGSGHTEVIDNNLGETRVYVLSVEAIKKIQQYYKEQSLDNSQIAPTGGIDLTSDKALQVQNDGQGGIKFNVSTGGGSASGGDPAMLERLQNTPGFTPVIINIQPMNDIRMFLGIKETSGNSAGAG